ncbi:phosphatase PAP2 family protein [Acuticoccus sediminis]|uniref:phosphatase PAP2 family protein n=1 Tax=Acuticoccus sediminis TaxID=2184697 RepID=UPI001CFE8C0C|nr:phosphatase PAP2 family protein [Acuticoccus sediminis]
MELRVLGAALIVGACLWAFFGLADEVMEGETHDLDAALLLALRNPNDLSDPIGGVAVEEMARDITALGGVTIVAGVTIAVCGLLWLMRKRRTSLFVALAVTGGAILSTGFKQFFDRPRPDLVPHEVLVHSASFPSGHSMLAAVTYLTLATLVASVEARQAVKIYVIAVAVLVVIAVGFSRVYLGVHWPTDVAAGWTAGTAWAIGCWGVARWLQRRGDIEPAPPTQP